VPPDPLSLARVHRRLVYIIDVGASALRTDGLLVEVATQKHTRDGEWAAPRPLPLTHTDWLQNSDVADREIVQVLLRTESEEGPGPHGRSARRFVVRAVAFDSTLRRMAQSGRAFVRLTPSAPPFPVAWDDGSPWDVRLHLRSHIAGGARWYALEGSFTRDTSSMALGDPDVVIRGGLFIFEQRIHRFVDEQVFPLIVALRTSTAERMDSAGALALVAELHRLPRVPAIELPSDLPITHAHAPPVPVAAFRQVPETGKVEVDLLFEYGGTRVPARAGDGEVFDPATTTLHHRDAAIEREAQESLLAAGLRPESSDQGMSDVYRVDSTTADDTALGLARSGWRVTFDGAALREALNSELEVRTGIDWFELHGEVDFGGVKARIPELSRPASSAEPRVQLADGTSGVLSEAMFKTASLFSRPLGPRVAMWCAMDGHRSGYWTRCSPRRPRCASTIRSPGYATSCSALVESPRPIRVQGSPAPCASISAKDWVGSISCGNSALVVVSPTTWGSARQSRRSRCSRAGARRAPGHRW
jgi:hypothetical protein